ncbi:MAG: two-component system cell cycle sensor histidine kinase/response regulator CckA [Myxococcota bacterium]
MAKTLGWKSFAWTPPEEGALAQGDRVLCALPSPAPEWHGRLQAELLSLSAGLISHCEVTYMTTEKRWVRMTAASVQDSYGAVMQIQGVTRDVDGETRAAATTADEVLWLRALIDQLPEAVVVWRGGREILRNLRADAVLGGDAPGAGLSGFLGRLAPSDRPDVIDHLRASSGEQSTPLLVVRLLGAGERWLELSSSSLNHTSGSVVVTIFRDITERRRLELQAAAQERMATVGTLAAGVAHEINNPLSFVMLNLSMLQDELPQHLIGGGEAHHELMSTLRDAASGAERVQEVVRDLRTFSHTVDTDDEVVDVREAVRLAMSLGRHRIRHRSELHAEIPDSLSALGSLGRLSQVLLNLLVNAAQALESAGCIDGHIFVHADDLDDGVVITVTDDGPGIPPELLPRLFEPFFTTREVGEGSGLGLAICRGIIHRAGGTISARNRPSGGACFEVRLRRATDTEDAVTEERGPEPLGACRPVVLLVEDEPLLLRALSRRLQLHYDVISAPTGADAVDIISGGLVPDAVLLDVMMPRMDGPAVYQWLQSTHPPLHERVVFMTGGAVTAKTINFMRQTDAPVLDKPLKFESLREVLDMLSKRHASPQLL